ncbi:MAG: hypothetical protein WC620_11860 [Methanoregula sp.]
MKIALSIILVILAVLACGCTSTAPSPATTPAPAAIPAAVSPVTPSLIGTWTGTMLGYDESIEYTDYNKTSMSMVVAEQHGRLFSGNLKFRFNNTDISVPMAGVIGRDGRTFALVENSNGYTTGEIIGNDEIELIHLDDQKPINVAIDTLKKA